MNVDYDVPGINIETDDEEDEDDDDMEEVS